MFLTNDEMPHKIAQRKERRKHSSKPRKISIEPYHNDISLKHPIDISPRINSSGGRFISVTLIDEGLDEESNQILRELKNGIDIFSHNIGYLIDQNKRFIIFDNQIEGIIKSILEYGSKIVIKPLGEAGISLQKRTAYINREVVVRLAKTSLMQNEIDENMWFGIALTIYFLHEISHDSQGFPSHEDVQAVKGINQESGKRLFVELDLRSDYLAARTVSILEIFKIGTYNDKEYYAMFHLVWCRICRGMLEAFSKRNNRRKDKIRRIFGYLLMCCLVKDTYHQKSPMALSGELTPDWDKDCNKLSIQSNRKYWIHSVDINRNEMKKIFRSIFKEDYDSAEEEIRQMWKNLKRK